MYKEMSKDAFKHHDKWIIAFFPDTDSFFITDQRCFFSDTTGKLEFSSEKEAIKYFEEHLSYFLIINNDIMKCSICGNRFLNNKEVFLENTNKKYKMNNQ